MRGASTNHLLSRALASAFLATDWTEAALYQAARIVLQSRSFRVAALVATVQLIARPLTPTHRKLAAFIRGAPIFPDVVADFDRRHLSAPLVLIPERAAPLPPFAELDLPSLSSPAELADWLEVPPRHLDWLADPEGRNARSREPSLHHYTTSWREKRNGTFRLIEAPKVQVKNCQRRILREILDKVPAHPSAHGFVRGRSCQTGAAIHVGEQIVVTLDLADFFLTVPIPRVFGIFRSLGYASPIARLLTGLCSTVTPPSALPAWPRQHATDWRERRVYFAPHLAQGAPTSPALANLVAWRLDCRLHGLARAFEANYTRYADDLTFSGGSDLAGRVGTLLKAVRDVVTDEGFRVNEGKLRIMRASGRQQVTGIVVNEHQNIERATFDQLKAILHNCRKLGPAGQNRDGLTDFRAHLDGRVNWVENLNPARGAKLRRTFREIDWGA